MLNVCQLKAARNMLGWSAAELAKRSNLGVTTIRRYELQVGIPTTTTANLITIKKTLEDAGIEFIGDPLKNPGVIMHL